MRAAAGLYFSRNDMVPPKGVATKASFNSCASRTYTLPNLRSILDNALCSPASSMPCSRLPWDSSVSSVWKEDLLRPHREARC